MVGMVVMLLSMLFLSLCFFGEVETRHDQYDHEYGFDKVHTGTVLYRYLHTWYGDCSENKQLRSYTIDFTGVFPGYWRVLAPAGMGDARS